jgi:hypothetical protein
MLHSLNKGRSWACGHELPHAPLHRCLGSTAVRCAGGRALCTVSQRAVISRGHCTVMRWPFPVIWPARRVGAWQCRAAWTVRGGTTFPPAAAVATAARSVACVLSQPVARCNRQDDVDAAFQCPHPPPFRPANRRTRETRSEGSNTSQKTAFNLGPGRSPCLRTPQYPPTTRPSPHTPSLPHICLLTNKRRSR